jgi:hypothetical protein
VPPPRSNPEKRGGCLKTLAVADEIRLRIDASRLPGHRRFAWKASATHALFETPN